MGDELLELKEKDRVSREEAAARLRAIADELASGNDVIFERNGMRIVAKVPDEVDLKIEFEIGDDETELEIELTWGRLTTGATAGSAGREPGSSCAIAGPSRTRSPRGT